MIANLEAALRLIRVVVPADGSLLVLAESYFDETNTHQTSERLCVGGYIFLREKAELQAVEWAKLLDKWKLPFFHMVDCAHNAEDFEHLSAAECDLAAREAIRIIKETASAGVCVTVNQAEYDEIVPALEFFGGAYESCARDILTGVSDWIAREAFSGEMHYFFEEGAEGDAKASWSILTMMRDPDIRKEARYAGHSFVPKVRSPGVQAADILAWHAGQDCKRTREGRPMRKDFASLCEIPHRVIHINRAMLLEKARIIEAEMRASGLTKELVDKVAKLARQSPRKGG